MKENSTPKYPGISFYIASFFVVGLLLFFLISWWMMHRIDTVQRSAVESAMSSANREIETAVSYTINDAQRYAMDLANWDETRQQIGNPTYYPYWRENRALQGSHIPSYGFTLEIYDIQGKPLVRTGPDHQFPKQLPKEKIYVTREAELFSLYYFESVMNSDHSRTLGHVGIRVDFLSALLLLNHFRFLDPSSISMELAPDTLVTPENITAHMRFSLLPGIDTSNLETVMRDTLRHLVIAGVILGLLYFLLMQTLLGRPLRHLTRHIDELRTGKSDCYVNSEKRLFPLAELETLHRSFNQYQFSLDQVHQDLDQKNEELWDLAHMDSLTGVFNRRAYDDDWRHLSALVKGRRHSVSVILFDCDHFKAINDTYGHDMGDKVLKVMADTLVSTLREGDRLYRLGGDEFAMQLLDASHKETHHIAQRCLSVIGQYDFRALGIREPIRLSVGIAHCEGTELENLQQLHKQADIAMYQAKRPGGNKIISYRPDMAQGADALVSSRYLNAIHQVIDNGLGLQPHFQEILSLDPEGTTYHEMLVRISDEEGLIRPAHIFPVVESHNLETEFDFAIIQHLAGLLDRGVVPDTLNISLNLAGPTLLHPELGKQLMMLKPYLSRHKILLEVTENALITELWQASEVLRKLRGHGFSVALDDFGSGYSSLRYLASMPVDIIKFDIAMVHDLEREDRQQIIVRDMARMIRDAGYQLVAEGVETEAMLNKVTEVGFTHAQGFLFGQPLPLEQLQQPLQQNSHSLQ